MMKKKLLLIVIVFLFFIGCRDRIYRFDSNKIKYLGHLNFGIAYSLVVKNNIAYVSHNKGVEIVDVSNAKKPTKLSRIKISDGAFGLALKGNLLFVAGDEDGLFIVDIKNPEVPKIISNFNGQKGTYQVVTVKENMAFIGLRNGKLVVLDIKIPKKPRELKTLNVSKGLASIIVVKNLLYIGSYNGIKLLDIGRIEAPQIVDIGLNDVFAQKMVWKDTILYVSSHVHGVKIFDISNSYKPQLIGSFNDGGEANGLFLVKNKLFVSDQSSGIVEVLDVSDPKKPKKMIEFLNCHPHGIVFKNNLLYVATTKQGLYILKPVKY